MIAHLWMNLKRKENDFHSFYAIIQIYADTIISNFELRLFFNGCFNRCSKRERCLLR